MYIIIFISFRTAISVLVCLISSVASSTSSEFEVRRGRRGWGEEGEVPKMEMPHCFGSGSSSSMTLPELSLREEHPASTCEWDCRVDLSSGLSKGMEKKGCPPVAPLKGEVGESPTMGCGRREDVEMGSWLEVEALTTTKLGCCRISLPCVSPPRLLGQ